MKAMTFLPRTIKQAQQLIRFGAYCWAVAVAGAMLNQQRATPDMWDVLIGNIVLIAAVLGVVCLLAGWLYHNKYRLHDTPEEVAQLETVQYAQSIDFAMLPLKAELRNHGAAITALFAVACGALLLCMISLLAVAAPGAALPPHVLYGMGAVSIVVAIIAGGVAVRLWRRDVSRHVDPMARLREFAEVNGFEYQSDKTSLDELTGLTSISQAPVHFSVRGAYGGGQFLLATAGYGSSARGYVAYQLVAMPTVAREQLLLGQLRHRFSDFNTISLHQTWIVAEMYEGLMIDQRSLREYFWLFEEIRKIE